MNHVRIDQDASADLCSGVDRVPEELQSASKGSEPSSRREPQCQILDTWLNLFFSMPPEKRRPVVRLWCKARPYLLAAYQRIEEHVKDCLEDPVKPDT